MLLHGDEFGRTQRGNNNAYCQDNEFSWMHWDLRRRSAIAAPPSRERVIALRNRHPLFRRRTFFRGRAVRESDAKDIVWLHPAGRRDDRRGMESGLRPLPRRAFVRTRPDRARRVRQAGRGRRSSAAAQRARRGRSVSAGKRQRGAVAACGSTPTAKRASLGRTVYASDAQYPVQGRSLVLLCRPRYP